jgi:hypothetical protein
MPARCRCRAARYVIGFATYVALALFIVRIQDQLPTEAELFVVFVSGSLVVIFVPLHPILAALGLMEGEWWTAPSFPGVLVAATAYSLLLCAISNRVWRD